MTFRLHWWRFDRISWVACSATESVLQAVVSLRFSLQVALHIPGAYNLSLHLPVVIGTVPYRRVSLPYVIPGGAAVGCPDFLTAPPPYREVPTPPPPIDGKSPPSLPPSASTPPFRVSLHLNLSLHLSLSLYSPSLCLSTSLPSQNPTSLFSPDPLSKSPPTSPNLLTPQPPPHSYILSCTSPLLQTPLPAIIFCWANRYNIVVTICWLEIKFPRWLLPPYGCLQVFSQAWVIAFW